MTSTHATPTLRYRLGMERPTSHLFQVELDLDAHPGDHLDLAMPAWTPGAYKLVDNARNVRGVSAIGADGTSLRIERPDFHTWRVHHEGQAFSFRYQVFANKMQIHQAQLDASHAFVNGCAVFVHPIGGQDWPCELTLSAPDGWKVGTALERTGAFSFRAGTYDEFIDCPLEIGQFEETSFVQDGVHYHVVWNGPDPMDVPKLTDGLKKVIKAETDFWGPAPFDRYVFIYNVTTDGFLNGLEHRNSTAIQGNINLERNSKGFFALTAHEFFHVWNVKRLRPIGFGPFDYRRPAHTTALWLVEGFTEYYTERMCLAAGISKPEDYLRAIADNLQHLEQSPGRHFTTLEEASFVTWNFGDDRWNGYVNYYLKGFLFGVALDFEIRRHTDNRRSLDDVMKLLWERYGATDIPYVPEDVEPLIEEVAGTALGDFFNHHLRSTNETDWTAVFDLVGLNLSVSKETPSLQARTVAKDGGLLVEDVRAQGAAWEADLQAGDLILTVDGRRATEGLVGRLDAYYRPGQEVVVRYLRNDREHETRLRLGGDRQYALIPQETLSPLQERILGSWLHLSTVEAMVPAAH